MRASFTLKMRSTLVYSLFKLYVEIADQFFPDLKNISPVYSHRKVQSQWTNTLQHADTSCFLNYSYKARLFLLAAFSSCLKLVSINQTILRSSKLSNHVSLCKHGLIKQQNTSPNTSKLCVAAVKLGKMLHFT